MYKRQPLERFHAAGPAPTPPTQAVLREAFLWSEKRTVSKTATFGTVSYTHLRFSAFLAGRGLGTVSERVCIDFVENQTGVRLGSLRESVNDRDVKAVRRPVVLLVDVLAGGCIEIDRPVICLLYTSRCV